MEKKIALQRWADLQPDLPILPHFSPIPADAKGSTFGACGIRISGNPQFIDAVLSRLKDLLSAEAGSTRLSLARNAVKPVFDKKWTNAEKDAETCYIQIRERTARTRTRRAEMSTAPLCPTITETSSSDFDDSETDAPKRVSALLGRNEDGSVIWDE